MARALKLLIAVPAAVVLVLFAIANRQVVTISFDPFSDPSVSSAVITAPLFILLFLVLVVGTFLGGVAAWAAQGANRRKGRDARDEAQRWRDECRRLRAQPPLITAAPSRQVARQDIQRVG